MEEIVPKVVAKVGIESTEANYKYTLYYRLYTSDFKEIKNGIDNC